jgi:hypothetical protein
MTVYDELLAELRAVRELLERIDRRDAIVHPTHLDNRIVKDVAYWRERKRISDERWRDGE